MRDGRESCVSRGDTVGGLTESHDCLTASSSSYTKADSKIGDASAMPWLTGSGGRTSAVETENNNQHFYFDIRCDESVLTGKE